MCLLHCADCEGNFFYIRPIKSDSFTNDAFGTNLPYNVQLKLFRSGHAFLEVVKYPVLPIEHAISVSCDEQITQTFHNWSRYRFNGIYVFRQFLGNYPGKTQLKCKVTINKCSRMLVSRTIQKPHTYPKVEPFSEKFSVTPLTIMDTKNGIVEWTNEPLTLDCACHGQVEVARNMGQLPVGLLAKIDQQLQDTKVYISLTTTPSRLMKLHYQLSSLDLKRVTKVLITIPALFKGKQKYKIPLRLMQRFPKVQFLFASFDLGPSLKIVGAVDYLKTVPNSGNDILIIMDDDNAYAPSMVNTLIYFSLQVPEGVINASPFHDSLEQFGLPPVRRRHVQHLMGLNRVEGFAGYAFRAGKFDTGIIKAIVRKDLNLELTPCFQSDDIVISYIFLYLGVPIYTTDVPHAMFYTHVKRKPLPYFEDADALHNLRLDGSKSSCDINSAKYTLTVELLGMFFVNFTTMQFNTLGEIIKKIESSYSNLVL